VKFGQGGNRSLIRNVGTSGDPLRGQHTHPARRAVTWPRSGRASAARRRTGPLPLFSQQVPRRLHLSDVPQVWQLHMASVTGSVPPLPRIRPSSHRLSRPRIALSSCKQAGAWARQQGAIAGGSSDRDSLPSLHLGSVRALGRSQAVDPRPLSQSTHTQSSDPTPREHVGGGVPAASLTCATEYSSAL
jgi:hypothetical protein